MAYEAALTSISLEAGADLSASQYRFVKVDANGRLVLAGVGEQAFGVLQNDPALGETGSVAVAGVTKLVAGAAVARGARLSANASGQAITATNTVLSDGTAAGVKGTPGCAYALESAAAAGEVISALVVHAGSYAA